MNLDKATDLTLYHIMSAKRQGNYVHTHKERKEAANVWNSRGSADKSQSHKSWAQLGDHLAKELLED